MNKQDYYLQQDEFLTDVWDEIATIAPRLYIHADTGAGKTTAVLSMDKIILVCSSQMALEQAAAEMRVGGENCGVYYQHGKTKDIHECGKILTIYESLPALLRRIPDPTIWALAVDEYHNVSVSGAKSYRNIGMQAVLDAIGTSSQWRAIYLLSGTPTHIPADFVCVRVTRARDQKYSIIDCCDGRANAAIAQILAQPDKRHIVYLNNKKHRLDNLIGALVAAGIADNDILRLNADERKNVMAAATDGVPENIRVIICTAILRESFSLRTNYDYIHVLETIPDIELVQLAARVRNAPAHVIIYRTTCPPERERVAYRTLATCRKAAHKLAAKNLQLYNDLLAAQTEAQARTLSEAQARALLPLQNVALIDYTTDADDGTHKYMTNAAAVESYAYELYARALTDNPDWLAHNLTMYNWQLVDVVDAPDVPANVIHIGKQAAQAAKRAAQATYATEHAALYAYTSAQDAIAAKLSLTSTQNEIVARIEQAIVDNDQQGDAYKIWLDQFATADTTAKRKRITRAAKYLALCRNSEMWREFYGGYAVGETVTADEIRRQLRHAVERHYTHAGEITARLNSKRVASLLSSLFVLKQAKKRAGDAWQCSITIAGTMLCDTILDSVFKNIHKIVSQDEQQDEHNDWLCWLEMPIMDDYFLADSELLPC